LVTQETIDADQCGTAKLIATHPSDRVALG
jgi:hypothetical protein